MSMSGIERLSNPIMVAQAFAPLIFELPGYRKLETTDRELEVIGEMNELCRGLGFVTRWFVKIQRGIVATNDNDSGDSRISLIDRNLLRANVKGFSIVKAHEMSDDVYLRALCIELEEAEIIEGEDLERFPDVISSPQAAHIPFSTVDDIILA